MSFTRFCKKTIGTIFLFLYWNNRLDKILSVPKNFFAKTALHDRRRAVNHRVHRL